MMLHTKNIKAFDIVVSDKMIFLCFPYYKHVYHMTSRLGVK